MRQKCTEEIFGWLRNTTNSDAIWLAPKKFSGFAAQINKTQRGSAWRPRRGLVCADFILTNLTVASCRFGYGHTSLWYVHNACVTYYVNVMDVTMICSIFCCSVFLCSKWLSFVYMTVMCVHFCCATVVSNKCHKLLDMTPFCANSCCRTFINGHICGHGCGRGLCRLLISLWYDGNLPVLGHVCNLCTFLFSNFSAANSSPASDLTMAVHIVIIWTW